MTHEEALTIALNALHDVGSALATRSLLSKPSMNPIIRLNLEKKTMTDKEIEIRVLDVWEDIVTKAEPRLKGTTIFECSPSDEPTKGQAK